MWIIKLDSMPSYCDKIVLIYTRISIEACYYVATLVDAKLKPPPANLASVRWCGWNSGKPAWAMMRSFSL